MVTIKDIARQAGVAKSTISRYLNGGSVSQKTREKIDLVIKETGYIPNVFAQSLKAKKTGLVGVVIPRLGSMATDSILSSLDLVAKENHQRLLIFNTNQEVVQELEGIETFAKQKVDYIILIATILREEHNKLIQSIDTPVVILGQQSDSIPSISYDDYGAGQIIGSLAVQKNVKKVTYVGVSEDDYAVGVLRKKGVLDTLDRHQVTYDVVETTFHLFDAYRLGLQLLKENTSDYIIAATDNIALGLLKAAHELNIKIPQDKMLSGFGGYSIADSVYPSITTVKYPYGQAGALALRHLMQTKTLPTHMILPVTLIERQSTQK